MKYLICLVALVLTACGGSGGGGASAPAGPTDPGIVAPVPVSKAITLHKGLGYSCFAYGSSVYCAGSANNSDLHINSLNYVERMRATGGITALRTWDDTLCIETIVAQSPYARAAGPATYCFGEASLNVRAEAIAYSPPYSHATNGTASVTYTFAPMAGADMTLAGLTQLTAFGDYIVTDGTGAVSTEALTCSLVNTTLTCPSFTAQVQ